jgi:hypothetical protein
MHISGERPHAFEAGELLPAAGCVCSLRLRTSTGDRIPTLAAVMEMFIGLLSSLVMCRKGGGPDTRVG